MAWEENSCISLNMQLIAILSRIGVCFVLLIDMWDLSNGGMNVFSAVACTWHEPSGGNGEPAHARLRHHSCPNQRKEQNHHRHKIRTRLLLHQSYQGREAYLHENARSLRCQGGVL